MNKKTLIVLYLSCFVSPAILINAKKNNHCCCAAAQQVHDNDFALFNECLEENDDILNMKFEVKPPTRTGNVFRKMGVGIAIKLLALKDYMAHRVGWKKNVSTKA